MRRAEDDGLGDPIEQAAAEWLARRDRGFSPAEEAAFAQWRAADPRHEAAVRELAALWGALDELGALRREESLLGVEQEGGVTMFRPLGQRSSLSGKRRARSGETIAPSDRGVQVGSRPARPRRKFRWPMLAMAAGLAVVTGGVLWRGAEPAEKMPLRHETAVGEQRVVRLPDGSEMRLNTNSSVDLSFTGPERRVRLERGEAFFNVTKDPARPFVVSAAETQTRVVGTAFGVRLRPAACEVLVAEGRVQFANRDRAAALVSARQHAVWNVASASPRVTTLDAATLARRLAWQTGRLEFHDTPLEEVVAEFNRYHRQQLALADAATAAIRVGGSFAIENLDGFVRLLEATFEIRVVRRDDRVMVLGGAR